MKVMGQLFILVIVMFAATSQLAASTLGYWRFEEGIAGNMAFGGGSIIDSSSFGNNGTSAGGPTYRNNIPADPIPKTGASNALSLEFDGSNDEVLISSMFPFHQSNDVTLEFWFRFPLSAHRSVFWTRPDNSDTNRFNIFVNGNGTFGFDYRSPSGVLHLLVGASGSGIFIPANTWTHVAITRVGNVYSLYVNGVLSATATDNAPDLPNSIGWQMSGRSGFIYLGYLDEVRISAGALTPAEFLRSEIVDTDNDGIPDAQDICPGGDDSVDTDGDNVPDFCDPCPLDMENDTDGDGVCGSVDICPGGNDNQNTDGDSLPDFCDVCPFDSENDADGDGVCESNDNCPLTANANQSNSDNDAAGDACDADDDNDGICDAAAALPDVCQAGPDNCPLTYNSDQADFDGDGVGDACDTDDDNDGVVDNTDQCPATAQGAVVNSGGCSIADLCPCGNLWKNHGTYVSCVARTAESFLASGLITEAQKDAIVSEAGTSTCGSKK